MKTKCGYLNLYENNHFRCYLKLGTWQENLEGINVNSIRSVLRCYEKATEYDKDWYKAWHAWAYINFETVLLYRTKQEKDTDSSQTSQSEKSVSDLDVNEHAVCAVKGFFK